MKPGLDERDLERIWRWSVLPHLKEYHVDKQDAWAAWQWDGVRIRALRNAPPADALSNGAADETAAELNETDDVA